MKADIVKATLLADPKKKLVVSAAETQTKITLPTTAPDSIATVIRLNLRGAPVKSKD
jgi:hypothetical protein